MTVLTCDAILALEGSLADAIAAADAAQQAKGSADEAAGGLKRENAHLLACLTTTQRDAADARAAAASAGMSSLNNRRFDPMHTVPVEHAACVATEPGSIRYAGVVCHLGVFVV